MCIDECIYIYIYILIESLKGNLGSSSNVFRVSSLLRYFLTKEFTKLKIYPKLNSLFARQHVVVSILASDARDTPCVRDLSVLPIPSVNFHVVLLKMINTCKCICIYVYVWCFR